jgi:hypothetical protein
MTDDNAAVYGEFNSLVNMTPGELEKWLQTDDSRSVGIKKETGTDKKCTAEGPESTGHESGRMIVDILQKDKSDLSDDDYVHMKRVNSYIKRHVAQRPAKEEIETSRWRYSLMNWGNDPLTR